MYASSGYVLVDSLPGFIGPFDELFYPGFCVFRTRNVYVLDACYAPELINRVASSHMTLSFFNYNDIVKQFPSLEV